MFNGKFSEEYFIHLHDLFDFFSLLLVWYFSHLITLAFFFFFFADYKTRDCIPQLVTCYLQKKINIDPLVTHQFPFDQIHQAFELYQAGKA